MPNPEPLHTIDPRGVYSPQDLARITGTGLQSWYRPIRRGALKASRINDRGDLRVLGAWALDYLEQLATQDSVTA